MKSYRFLVPVTLITLGAIAFVFQSDYFRSQVTTLVNHGTHSHTHEHAEDSETRTKVDEALLRVPLPPKPVELKDQTRNPDIAASNLKATTSSPAKNERAPKGIAFVETDVTSLAECSARSSDAYGCYADYLTNTVQTKSIETAFVETKAAYNAGDQQVISLCHQLVHVIGRAATAVFPTVAEAYNYGDTFCWSGYYHGIMEAVITQMGIDNVPKQLNSICNELPGKDTYSFNYFNCVHGLGHGLMYVEEHELFAALELCDGLDGGWERSSCYGGVFMENVIANEVDHFSKYLKDDDLLYPCNAVDEKYKEQCYLMQTSYMLKELSYDFATVFDACVQADSNHVRTCYQSLGRDASGFTVSDPGKAKAICLLGPDEVAQSNCVTGAVKDFISYHHSDVQANGFCELLPENLSAGCLHTAQNYYQSFSG